VSGLTPKAVGHHVEMAGTIEVRPGHWWSGATWLFNWTLRAIASASEDVEVAAILTGIV
jgi:hypothetical protein